jgi:hypothetical protein
MPLRTCCDIRRLLELKYAADLTSSGGTQKIETMQTGYAKIEDFITG